MNSSLFSGNGTNLTLPPVSRSDYEDIVCPECKNSVFGKFFKILRLPAIKSPNGKAMYVNLPVYVCASCALVLDTENSAKDTSTEEKIEAPADKTEVKED